jgi:carbonic anhydrase
MHINRICCLSLLLFFGMSALPVAFAQSEGECKNQPFSYDDGPAGQRNWCGECNNKSRNPQAPINIDAATAQKADLPGLVFNYKPTKLLTYENFYNLKVDYKKGDSSVKIGEESFNLVEFHFHRPSEEAVNNLRYAMVIHLVHKNDSGPVKVISVFVKEGQPNEATRLLVDTLIKHFPLATGAQVPQDVIINAEALLPPADGNGQRGYYRYEGSLTTPGCDGGVTFYVLKTPVLFSPDQLRQFERRYPSPNARNIQDTFDRKVEQTKY